MCHENWNQGETNAFPMKTSLWEAKSRNDPSVRRQTYSSIFIDIWSQQDWLVDQILIDCWGHCNRVPRTRWV